MSRDVILIRTRAIDPKISALALQYAAGRFQTGAIVDANYRQGEHNLDAVFYSQDAASLSLFMPEDAPWCCGDHGLYLARRHFLQARYFWLIEDDVKIRFSVPSEFFSSFDHAEDDFFCSHLTEADEGWWWRRSMSPFHERIYRCLFSVVRLSARAIDFLLERRRAIAPLHRKIKLWPNDEAFVATELMTSGFSCRDLCDVLPGVYTDATLSYWRPHSETKLATWALDGKLYHPVLSGVAFRKKAEAFCEKAAARATELLPDLAAEFGKDEARAFLSGNEKAKS